MPASGTIWREVLPLIAGDIDRLSLSPDQLTRDQMDAMTKKYGVEDIYFIDRSHKIFQTNSSTDMNMQFPESDFTRFLDSVFGKDKVMGVGIDISDADRQIERPTVISGRREKTTSSRPRPRSNPASRKGISPG